MAKYKKQSSNFSLLSYVPWWIYVAIDVYLFYFFKYEINTYTFNASNKLQTNVFINHLIHTELFLKATYAAELVLAYLALKSFLRSYNRKQFLKRKRSIDDLKAMPWQEFELLVAAVYRKLGFQVVETGLGGADGGIDLLMYDGPDKIIVQCKRWASTSVGAPTVREMYGLMSHHEASEVKIVCVGKFTKEANLFAEGKPIDLVSGDDFLELLRSC
jgi:restriction system protein